MTFKKRIGQIHLWLGLASGIIVIIVSLTGCIYVFEKEIRNLTEPYQFVEVRQKPYLPPSRLKQIAEKHLEGNIANNVMYRSPGLSATVGFFDKQHYYLIYLNQYTGEVLKVKNMNRDFFRFILDGHYYLWLPPVVGHPTVATGTLLFVILLITGLVLWWPKNLNKANTEKSFKIKWGASFKRVNYDLHNVLGFYVTIIALIIALTGLVWGFEWFAKSAYWVTSGGKTMPTFKPALSDTTQTA
ncbi:MAG: PepSY-associated TM helix domain-containing protein, partial [Siphonobacter sp.]